MSSRPTAPSSRPWALLTGASSGIGRALTPLLAARGHGLVLVARREEELRRLAASLPVPTRVLALDLSEPAAWARLDEATTDLDLGVVVLNAGIGGAGPFLAADPEAEQALVRLNVGAVLAACHRFGRRLAARGSGQLVLLSSVLAFQGVEGSATYAASKALVQALAEGLRPELGRRGVDVLAVAPGPTHTEFAARAGMRMGLADPAARVARSIDAALGGRGTRFPGLVGRLLRWGVLTLPRPLRSFIFGRAVAGMIPVAEARALPS